jgi:hypothetical protein
MPGFHGIAAAQRSHHQSKTAHNGYSHDASGGGAAEGWLSTPNAHSATIALQQLDRSQQANKHEEEHHDEPNP